MDIVKCNHCNQNTKKADCCLWCNKTLDKNLVILPNASLSKKSNRTKKGNPPYYILVIIMVLLSFFNVAAIWYLIVGFGGSFILKKMYE